jgi:DNA-binding response OmpR family regulator/predicted ATPase
LQLAIGTVDLRRGAVRTHRGEVRHLTPRERQLLEWLAARPGRVQPRQLILREVWGHAPSVVSRAADDTMKRLRQKIEEDPAHPIHLITEHGTGFRFEPLRAPAAGAEPVAPPPTPGPQPPTLQLDACWVDLQRGRVHRPFGPADTLTAQEVAVLQRLAAAPGQIVSRASLLPDGVGRAVDNLVQRLRAKIGPSCVQTARGRGYRLVVPSAPADAREPPRTNLVRPLEPLVGREVELQALARCLEVPGAVSVVGPAGVGKSSLAREHALRAGDLPGGAWCCDLTGVTTAASLIAAAGRAMGLQVRGDDDARARALASALHRRGPTLLVLDNADQLGHEAYTVVVGWCSAAPALSVLITARHRAGLPGSRAFPLGPLPLDQAVALYEARARRLAPAPPDRAQVEGLVAALDGLPLAIELAAARAATLSPAEVVTSLAAFGLDVLSSPDAPDRHRAMAATLRWSWARLDAPARALLAQCSVFRAPFSLDLAAAVVALPDGAGAPTDLLDALQALYEHSLIHHAPPDGIGARFTMLGVVRRFAHDQLPPDAAPALRSRHARAVADRAEARGRDDEAKIAWQLDHRDDLLAAIDHALADPAPGDTAARLLLAARPLLSQGSVAEHLRLLERCPAEGLSLERSHRLILERCKAARIAAAPGVIDDLERLIALPDLGEATAIEALVQLGDAHLGRRDLHEGVETHRAALARARALGDPDLIATCAEALGAASIGVLDLEGAEALLTEALVRYEAAGHAEHAAQVLNLLGEVALRADAEGEARSLFERALRIAPAGALHARATAHLHLGELWQVRGDPAAALSDFEAAAPLLLPLGRPRLSAYLSLSMGIAAHCAGDLVAAEGHLTAAAATAPDSARGIRGGVAAHRSVLAAQQGRHREAGRLLAAAEALLLPADGSQVILLVRALLQVAAHQPPNPPVAQVLQQVAHDPSPSIRILRGMLERAARR